MSTEPIHYGWMVSPYTAKTRSYFRHKGIAFIDKEPNAIVLSRTVKPAVGRLIMPTVQLSNGTWLQDSSCIIDQFEKMYPNRSVFPMAPSQRLASYLLEVLADEWLPMAALYYRWTIAQNKRFALNEFARAAVPWLPSFLGRPMIASLANRMQGYLPILGVNDHTAPAVEETVQTIVRALEDQLQHSSFLLGNRPCLGDFAMFGPLWAHLYRDPGSRYVFDSAPRVVQWMETLRVGDGPHEDWLANDEVSVRLDPLFRLAFEDQWTWIRQLVSAIDEYCAAHPKAHRVPRALGFADFCIRGRSGSRKLITFVQWKAQRARDAYEAAGGSADPWIRRVLQREADSEVSEVIPPIRNPFKLENYKAVLTTAS